MASATCSPPRARAQVPTLVTIETRFGSSRPVIPRRSLSRSACDVSLVVLGGTGHSWQTALCVVTAKARKVTLRPGEVSTSCSVSQMCQSTSQPFAVQNASHQCSAEPRTNALQSGERVSRRIRGRGYVTSPTGHDSYTQPRVFMASTTRLTATTYAA